MPGAAASGFLAAHMEGRQLVLVGGENALSSFAENGLRIAFGMCDLFDYPEDAVASMGPLAYSAPEGSLAYGAGEFVTICNVTDEPLDLSGWRLEETQFDRVQPLPQGLVAEPHTSVHVHSADGESTPDRYFAGRDEELMDDNSGSLTLIDRDGVGRTGLSWDVLPPGDG